VESVPLQSWDRPFKATPVALRCLQGLTDGNDAYAQESDYFGKALVEFAGLLTPDALGDPNVKLIRADDATLMGSEGRPGVATRQLLTRGTTRQRAHECGIRALHMMRIIRPVGHILRRDARANGGNSSLVTSPIDPTNEQDLGCASTRRIDATFSTTTILIN